MGEKDRIDELEHTVMLLIDALGCQRGEPNNWWQGMIDRARRHGVEVLGPGKVHDRPSGSFLAEYMRGFEPARSNSMEG